MGKEHSPKHEVFYGCTGGFFAGYKKDGRGINHLLDCIASTSSILFFEKGENR